MIKILRLLKSFAFLMLSLFGAFLQKWIDQAYKRLSQPYRLSNNENQHIFVEKIKIDGHDRNIVSSEIFNYVMLSILVAFFVKKDRPSKYTGCLKKKMSIYLNFSHQNVWISFFGHPVWLKQPFISLVYLFLKKRLPNYLEHHKGKTYQET